MKERENNIEKKLKGLKNTNPFKVPEGYFNEFASRVQDRIHEQKKPSFREQISSFLRPQIALATALATVALLIFVAIKIFVKEEEPATNDLYTEMYEIYMYDLNEEQIIEMMYSQDADEQGASEEAYEQEIIDYLLDEGVEITELYEEF